MQTDELLEKRCLESRNGVVNYLYNCSIAKGLEPDLRQFMCYTSTHIKKLKTLKENASNLSIEGSKAEFQNLLVEFNKIIINHGKSIADFLSSVVTDTSPKMSDEEIKQTLRNILYSASTQLNDSYKMAEATNMIRREVTSKKWSESVKQSTNHVRFH